MRRCLIPVTGFYCHGDRGGVLFGHPWTRPLFALAGVLAWSPTFGREVCVSPACHMANSVSGSAPLPVASEYRLRWCHSDARQDLVHLLEGQPWVEPIRFDASLKDGTWSPGEEIVQFSAYPPERDLHFLPSPPTTGQLP
jgi:hypothetical protein